MHFGLVIVTILIGTPFRGAGLIRERHLLDGGIRWLEDTNWSPTLIRQNTVGR